MPLSMRPPHTHRHLRQFGGVVSESAAPSHGRRRSFSTVPFGGASVTSPIFSSNSLNPAGSPTGGLPSLLLGASAISNQSLVCLSEHPPERATGWAVSSVPSVSPTPFLPCNS